MIPLQFFSVLFGLFMIYILRVHFKKGHFEQFEFKLWLVIWGGFITLAIFPQLLQPITQQLRISRVFDSLTLIAFMFLTLMSYFNRVSIRKMEKKLERSVRDSAIKKLILDTKA